MTMLDLLTAGAGIVAVLTGITIAVNGSREESGGNGLTLLIGSAVALGGVVLLLHEAGVPLA